MGQNTEHIKIINPDFQGKRINVTIDPGGENLSMPWIKTARQLLYALNLGEETALVARDGQLLTPDRHLWPDDHIWVRKVASGG